MWEHLDGPRHFDTAGRDIAALELTKLCAPGVSSRPSDMAEDFGIYTPEEALQFLDDQTEAQGLINK